MASTTKYKLPYPERSDFADVPEDMKELAEKVEETIIDVKKINTVLITTTEEIAENTDYTIPLNYIVGDNSLEIYYMGEKLVKDEHYIEVGEEGEVSNIIQFYDWGQAVPVDRLIEFIVRGVV